MMSHRPSPSLVEGFTRLIALRQLRDCSVERALQALDGTEGGHWEPLPEHTRSLQAQYFLPAVSCYWGSPQAASAGGREEVTSRRWSPSALRVLPSLRIAGKNTSFVFSLAALELYAFGTGIVGLVVELALSRTVQGDAERAPTFRDLALFNYWLRPAEEETAESGPAARGGGRSRVLVADGPSPPVTPHERGLPAFLGAGRPTLPGLINEAFRPIAQHVLPLDERQYKVLTYARLGGPHTWPELAEDFVRVSRVQRRTYRVSPEDLVLHGNPGIYRSFRTSFVGCSVEGFAVLAVDRDPQDPHVPKFFQELADRVRHTYFAHYMLALHQRATLTSLAARASSLPLLSKRRLTYSDETRLREVRDRAVDFSLRHRFAVVSIHTTYVEFYDRLRHALAIDPLLAKVQHDAAEMDELLRRREQYKLADGQRRLNRTVAVLGVLATLFALYGVNFAPYAERWTATHGGNGSWFPLLGHPAFWGPLVISLLCMLLLLVASRDPRRP